MLFLLTFKGFNFILFYLFTVKENIYLTLTIDNLLTIDIYYLFLFVVFNTLLK